jgi:hypothetical protein
MVHWLNRPATGKKPAGKARGLEALQRSSAALTTIRANEFRIPKFMTVSHL